MNHSAGQEQRCTAHDRSLSWHEAGYRGLPSRRWLAMGRVSGWAVQHASEPRDTSPTLMTIEAGIRLRLDQTDVTQQGCSPGDFIVSQRFQVLDGPADGRCIEFTCHVPPAYAAWIPDGLAQDDREMEQQES